MAQELEFWGILPAKNQYLMLLVSAVMRSFIVTPSRLWAHDLLPLPGFCAEYLKKSDLSFVWKSTAVYGVTQCESRSCRGSLENYDLS